MCPFYDDKVYFDTLKWDDCFVSEEQFATDMEDVGGITDVDSLKELYRILSMKYVTSYTRYTNKFAFMMALKRELHTEFPFYLQKKTLANEMMEMEIAEIQRGARSLRNVVDQHDDSVVNANTVAIDDLSTTQESIETTANKLDAVKQKYNVMNRNWLQGIYKQCDELFRVILSEDVTQIYETDGE